MATWLDDDDQFAADILAGFEAGAGGARVRYPGDAWPDLPPALEEGDPGYPQAFVGYDLDTLAVQEPYASYGAGDPSPARTIRLLLFIHVQAGTGVSRAQEIRRLLAAAAEAFEVAGVNVGPPRSYPADSIAHFDVWGLALDITIDG